jgi:molybdopterin/thiamine biosynthesis adenylyltransferase
MFDSLNEYLLTKGFKRGAPWENHKFVFLGEIECTFLERDVKKLGVMIGFNELPMFEKPNLYLTERPAPLDRLCVHIENASKYHSTDIYPICILDSEAKQIDPYQPEGTLEALLSIASDILKRSQEKIALEEFEMEFAGYFGPNAFGISKITNLESGLIKCFRIQSNSTSPAQFVLSDNHNKKQINFWLKKLGLKDPSVSDPYATALIRLDSIDCLPSTPEFNHSSLAPYLNWLKTLGGSCYAQLRKQMTSSVFRRNIENNNGSFVILLEVRGEYFGLLCSLKNDFTGRFINSGSRNFKALHNPLVSSVDRILFEEVGDEQGVKRNFLESNLIGKNIAVIGCGTLGGYVISSLFKAGAGCRGKLTFYDNDTFSIKNTSRHILGANYFGRNKASALEEYLHEQGIDRKLDGKAEPCPNINDLSDFDIIIDTTGDYAFSIKLNYEYLAFKSDNKPLLYHIALFAGGESSRIFKMGNTGCYRCMDDKSFKRRFPDFKREEDKVAIKKRCGESYLPFPISASMRGAGLMLSVLLDGLDTPKAQSMLFFEAYSKRVKDYKNQELVKQVGCPQCEFIRQ